jgi:outer membrane protein
MRGRRAAMAGCVAAALSIPMAAPAADSGKRGDVPPSPWNDWTVTIGAEGRFEPSFQGSKNQRLRPYPVGGIRRFGTPERFSGTRDGIGVGLFEDSNFRIGTVGQFKAPRRESDDAALRGLGDVPWAVEVGLFAEYWWVPWLRTRGELRQGFHGHHGLVADIALDAVAPVGAQLTLSAGPRVTFATSRALGPYFSIDAAQSAASGLPVFAADGGVRSVGLGTKARYQWTPQWATHAFVEFERLTGDAERSPLVTQRGSADQLTIGLGATRSFDIKLPW